jgi:hypothetical protein
MNLPEERSGKFIDKNELKKTLFDPKKSTFLYITS